MRADLSPIGSHQNQDSEPASSKILLILQILVGSYHYFETFGFSRPQQVAVLHSAPSAFVSSCDLVAAQCQAQWHRGALIEKNFHPGRI